MKKKATSGLRWLAGGGLILTCAAWFWNADRLVVEDPRGHPTMPIGVREHVKLARGWGLFDRGSLRLVCTSTNELRLVLQTLMPERELRPARRSLSVEAYEALLNVPGDFEAILYIDGQTTHSLPLPQARFASIRSVDTIVSAPLSEHEIEGLADWMDETWRKRFGFMALEQGIFMHGFARGDEVRTLADRCAERPTGISE
jgi:hypothetical protein